MTFSYGQQVLLALVPKFSSSLSILGSFWIVVEVLTRRSKRKNVYQRLMLFMSANDIMVSIWYFASTWPIPKGTEGVAFAMGNEKTCIVQGFFLQLGIISPIYNCCLAIYYMLVVQFGVSEERLSFNVEPAMHLFAISAGLLTAVAGIYLDVYNNANLWCWISSLPLDCDDSYTFGVTTCIRGDNVWIFRWSFFYGPLWIIIFLVTIIMASVYCTVRTRLVLSKEAIRPASRGGRNSIISRFNTSSKTSTFAEVDIPSTRLASSGRIGPGDGIGSGTTTSTRGVSESSRKNDNDRNGPTRTSSIMRTRSALLTGYGAGNMVMPKKMARLYSSRSNVSSVRSNEQDQYKEDAHHVLQTIETFKSANYQNVRQNKFGSKAVFRQSCYYTLGFYVTYSFATINRVFQQAKGATHFGLILLHAFFIPLHGFFNVLVYRYAYCIRLKHRNPHMTGWQIFFFAWRWTFLGPPPIATSTALPDDDGDDNNNNNNNTIKSNMPVYKQKKPTRLSISGNDSIAGFDPSDLGIQIADDVLDPTNGTIDVNGVTADLLMSYAEYPNMLSEDAVMVNYPTIIEEDENEESYMGGFPTTLSSSEFYSTQGGGGGGKTSASAGPQPFPTTIYE